MAGGGTLETHQLAGLDARERRFNRPVEYEAVSSGFRAVLRYESERVTAEHPASTETALQELVRILHAHGYRQLRSQLSFKNGAYLGSQEPWIEYPDPPPSTNQAHGLMERVRNWLRRTAIR
jgi:hypothetical protein